MSDDIEKLARLGRLVRKELLEILRDRRTIITLVAMPLLLYPLLSVAFQQFIVVNQASHKSEDMRFRIGLSDIRQLRALHVALQEGQDQLRKQRGETPTPAKATGDKQHKAFPWALLLPADLAKHFDEKGEPVKDMPAEELLHLGLRKGAIQLVVHLKPAEGEAANDKKIDCELQYLEGSPMSQAALTFVDRHIAAYNLENLERRLAKLGGRPIEMVQLRWEGVKSPAPDSMVSLGAMVPLILILMTITGAVYPAIDLTAGERERGTLEVLIAAPVPRLGLLFAKYVTVVTIAVLTAVINLASMILTLTFTGLAPILFPEGGLTPLIVLQLLGLLLLFAAFFSAVLLSLTSFARSFKEAQAYLIPLMLASLGPGLIGLTGIKLTGLVAAAPLVNIVLLARDLFQGGADPGMALVVVVATLLYAAAAITLAARVFGAEGVLYNEQTGWADLFRRPEGPRAVATVPAALWCLALMIPTYFVARSVTAHFAADLGGAGVMLATFLVSALLFVVYPGLWAWFGRVEWQSGFRAWPARPGALLGGSLLGLSLWPLVLQMLAFLHRESNMEELSHGAGGLLEALRLIEPVWLPIPVMVGVALVEEWFFRGYLFAALKPHLAKWGTIILTAILFGLMHVFQLGFERLPSSTLLGLVLGWVCWETGSVVPGMLLHGLTNGILMSLTQGGADLGSDVPALWLAGGAVGTAAGLAVIWYAGRKVA